MTIRLFSHFADIIKDVLFVVVVGKFIKGGGFFLRWVRIQPLPLLNLKFEICYYSGFWIFDWNLGCTIHLGFLELGNVSPSIQFGLKWSHGLFDHGSHISISCFHAHHM